MKRSASLPVLVLIAVSALVLGSIGTTVAAPALTKGKVKSIATKVVTRAAPGLSVASATNATHAANATNATNLNGHAASTYLTQAYTVGISNVAATNGGFIQTLPPVPAGTYQLSLYLSATMSVAAEPLYCGVDQVGNPDLLDLYAAQSNEYRTVQGSRIVTIAATGALSISCLIASGTVTVPATSTYGGAQVQFLRLNNVTALGTAS
jgi:hypothetical protein